MVETKSIQMSQKKQDQKDIIKGHPVSKAEDFTKQKTKKDDKKVVEDSKNNAKALTHDHTHSHDHEGHDHKHEEKDEKKDDKKDEKKKEVSKKEEAIARGTSLRASKKHIMYICNFIKGKTCDTAISQLSEVLTYKRAIPFKGEIPHRKGDMMSGRYPQNATRIMINVLKALRGNIIVNGLDSEKAKIYLCSASWASRPARRGGMRFKRTNVILKAKEMENKNTKEKK